MDRIKLSVVMPGFNEAGVIKENVKKVHSAAGELGVPFEIIFVNDGSTDSTDEEVRSLMKSLDKLAMVGYSENRGRGFALRKGIEKAEGEYIITTESDLNWGTEIIRRLYEDIVRTGNDIVVACPYIKGGKLKNVPFVRAFLSKVGNKVLAASLGNVVHMVSGMTRIYRSQCIKNIYLASNDKEIHLEILSKALALGFQVSEIPAVLAWPDKKTHKKGKRKSSFSARKYINSHLLFTLFERPILFFGFVGIIILLAGILIGGYIVYLRFAGNLNPTRPLMTLVVLMVLGGVLLVSFGIIGMQINDLRKEIYRIQSRSRDE